MANTNTTTTNDTPKRSESLTSPTDTLTHLYPGEHASHDSPAIPPPPPILEKLEISEDEHYEQLGYCFSPIKKWSILLVIFLVQVSMNFNTSLYSNALNGISGEFSISTGTAVWGAGAFLITYAFGCELWAPWSEEIGRWPVLQASLSLVNAFALMAGLAPNWPTLLAARALGGLSTAGGSVTLGMVADMFGADDQQMAVAFIVFSSVGGSILGPIVGGFVEAYLPWRWATWLQLLFGAFVQLLHAILVPETRSTIILDRIARRGRRSGDPALANIYGPDELVPFVRRFHYTELLETWKRPFVMFATEPIVLVLSLLSGFADALIFMQIQSFSLVYEQWNFGSVALGLAFVPIGIGYVIAWALFVPAIRRNRALRVARPASEYAQFESRLWLLLFTAPCLPAGLLAFAFTTGGPPLPWAPSMVAAGLIGVSNYAIYMATIDYMVAAYGPYAASATGGNGWARDMLAGVLTPVAVPFYRSLGLRNASLVLCAISGLLVAAVFVVYRAGPALRRRSPFAESLLKNHNNAEGTGVLVLAAGGDDISSQQEKNRNNRNAIPVLLTPPAPILAPVPVIIAHRRSYDDASAAQAQSQPESQPQDQHANNETRTTSALARQSTVSLPGRLLRAASSTALAPPMSAIMLSSFDPASRRSSYAASVRAASRSRPGTARNSVELERDHDRETELESGGGGDAVAGPSRRPVSSSSSFSSSAFPHALAHALAEGSAQQQQQQQHHQHHHSYSGNSAPLVREMSLVREVTREEDES